jgi:alkanesulfonate monooxygenase SsuD/methylene tetrahydromethanopterin reductase-like flavin-dependent oxidoreductase (luciferase family)
MRVALMIEGQEGVTWEQWCALAARTTTLRLGTLVSPATFRLPGLLANAAATADHVSGGRIELGIGAGWMEREHRAFGFPFPETSVRVEMFAEQLEIVHRLWTEDRVDFHGRHYVLEDAPGLPKPVQKPHPPILVGGSGLRGTADPAARFADEYNSPFVSPDDFAAIRAKVVAACGRAGRDPATMRFSTMRGCLIGATQADALDRARELYGRAPRDADFDSWLEGYSNRSLFGSVDDVAEQLGAYERVGCDRVMLQHLLHADLEPVRLIGRELAPAVA